jgi:Iron-containing redox enzyme
MTYAVLAGGMPDGGVGGWSLAAALSAALREGERALRSLVGAPSGGRRDRALTLLAIYDLHTAPIAQLGDTVRWQGHPAVAEIKGRLELEWIDDLDAAPLPKGDAVAAMRRLATRDRIPSVYRWLAEDATWDQVVAFLALEGGPDAGFDDLVAACQLGLRGRAKLELATNYWDEMGGGTLAGIHTILHDRMVEAIAMPRIPRCDLPCEALERAALGGLLATNRWLQPEMLGALGLLELQAGPRCRMVLRAFDRLGAPENAYPFYAVHAQVDPLHGRTWLENAILPTVAEEPDWGPRIARGAWWRSQVNAAFFDTTYLQVALADGFDPETGGVGRGE